MIRVDAQLGGFVSCEAFLIAHTSARTQQAIRSARPAVLVSPDSTFDSPK